MSFDFPDISQYSDIFGTYQERRLEVIERFKNDGSPIVLGIREDNEWKNSGQFLILGQAYFVVQRENLNKDNRSGRLDSDVDRTGTKITISDSLITGVVANCTHAMFDGKIYSFDNNESLIVNDVDILHKLVLSLEFSPASSGGTTETPLSNFRIDPNSVIDGLEIDANGFLRVAIGELPTLP